MAHGNLTGVYRKLGKKIDAVPTRAPWNMALYEILKELYTPREAEILVRMPYGLSTAERIVKIAKIDKGELLPILEALCEKGLLFDMMLNGRYHYMISPMAVGIFEMTMMRTRGELDYARWAQLFNEYLHGSSDFYRVNCKPEKKISVMRVLPHEDTIDEVHKVEILDYEKATSIIRNSNKFGIGLCSCRHEKLHIGKKMCDTPLETCLSLGMSADYLIRHGFAREATRSEVLDSIAISKEYRLVLTADDVQKGVGFICQCCGCCCNLLLGISKHGFPDTVVTSSYVALIDNNKCTGCEKCSGACPIKAIKMADLEKPVAKKRKNPEVDESICLGCGVCALSCNKEAIQLVRREQRVFCPESTFERVILASLERGTLQYQLFDEPQKITHKFLRGFVGGFLRLPFIKQALMSERLRSRFLTALQEAARKRAPA